MSTRLVTDERVRAPRTCEHCGQPGEGDSVAGSPWFCCAGCEGAFALLGEAGLEEYYGFRASLGEPGQRGRVPLAEEFAELDAPVFQRLYREALDDTVDRAELELGGLHCAACVWLVERLPRLEPGVERAVVDLGRGRVTVDFRARGPSSVQLSEVARALARLGYAPRPARGLLAARERRQETRRLLVRVGVAGASAGNVMLIAFALYGGADEVAGTPEVGTMARATLHLFHAATLVASLPALWAAGGFFRGALTSLRARSPHMDLPIAIGIATAFVSGTVSIVRGSGDLYFDTITTLIFLLLIGRYLDVRHRQHASEATELLSTVLPGHARRIAADGAGDAERVPIESLAIGDLVMVKSGETVPVDGLVRKGHSSLDQSLMSGESKPVPVAPAALVFAGALNVGAELVIEVRKSGAETRVGGLLEAVERASRERVPLLGFANRLAGWFTWVVLACALCVFLAWAPRSLELAARHALAVLIVACPCALGMATPLALTAAVSQAARAGILVFGAASLERLAAPALVVLDKTGTLTLGRLRVTGRAGSTEIDPFVLALERDGHHPVARALAAHLEGTGVEASREIESAQEMLGAGIVARVPAGELLVGSATFVLERAQPTPEVAEALTHASAAQSPLLVALAGQAVAAYFLEDELRPDAAEGLRRLERLGHTLAILSGDGQATVAHVADALSRASGASFHAVLAGASPEKKLAQVGEWARTWPRIVMVGDGVNDAGALARAHVGVAVGGAAEAARLSADVYLSHTGVLELVHLMEGARRTLRTIQRGVGFSLCYNAVGIGLAAVGLLSPLVAAVLMPLSSLTVVSHALRSRSFRPGIVRVGEG